MQGRVAGKDAVDVALLAVDQVLNLLRVAVGRGLDQLFRQISGHVGLKQLLQQS